MVELALALRFNVMAAKTRGASTPNTAWHSEARDVVLNFPHCPLRATHSASGPVVETGFVYCPEKKNQDGGLVINADVICAV